MITQDLQLKIQAYLDGELDAAESEKVLALLTRQPDARLLYDRLAAIKTVISANEPAATLPEERPFYWSKIEQAIRREPLTAARASAGLSWAWLLQGRWLWRWTVPLAGAAACLALFLAGHSSAPAPHNPPRLTAQSTQSISRDSEAGAGAEVMSFYAPSAGMTVVWVDTGADAGAQTLDNTGGE